MENTEEKRSEFVFFTFKDFLPPDTSLARSRGGLKAPWWVRQAEWGDSAQVTDPGARGPLLPEPGGDAASPAGTRSVHCGVAVNLHFCWKQGPSGPKPRRKRAECLA